MSLATLTPLVDESKSRLRARRHPLQRDASVRQREIHLPWARLGLLTAAALAIHGYHLGVEDGEIYIPAARKLLHPNLYPYATQFFESQDRLSLFAPILAWTARLTHLSVDWTVFLWYMATLFATLAACWMLAAVSFERQRARWCAVLVITTILTMPATNTSLLLMDPYLTARSFSTPLTLFALVALLRKRFVAATLITALTAAIHPLMAAYLIFLAAVLWCFDRLGLDRLATNRFRWTTAEAPAAGAALLAMPAGFRFVAAQGAYREALYSRPFCFLSTWTWYHWLGLLAPLGFLVWFARGRVRGTTPQFARMSLALIPFGVISILAGAAIASTHRLDMFARLQPLRCFHLVTFVFMLFFAGVLGEFLAQKRAWFTPALCLPLAAGMFLVARATYPSSPQIEWPGRSTSSNAWVNTLFWIRANTPKDAVFAVDSGYFEQPGVDVHGFRALSARASLADYSKDAGVVTLFPKLADAWKQMSSATTGLNHFTAADFTRLAHEFPVTWTVIHGAAPAGMTCPYQQRGYVVCRIPDAPGLARDGAGDTMMGFVPAAETSLHP
jgi:hypothetical protein